MEESWVGWVVVELGDFFVNVGVFVGVFEKVLGELGEMGLEGEMVLLWWEGVDVGWRG